MRMHVRGPGTGTLTITMGVAAAVADGWERRSIPCRAEIRIFITCWSVQMQC
jgi:hypothetical protein